MDDKLIMTNLMDTSKGICELLGHAIVESDNATINESYKHVLEDCLTQQHQIYSMMKDMGWYPMENVKSQEVDKVKNKFCCE